MSAPFEKRVPRFLEKGCEFRFGNRQGQVLEMRPEGYFVFWNEWIDEKSGVIHESTAGVLSYEAVALKNRYGKLEVVRRPLSNPSPRDEIRRSEREAREIARMQFRKCFALVAVEMIEDGELEPTRDSFIQNFKNIRARGKEAHEEFVLSLHRENPKRGGARLKAPEDVKHAKFEHNFKSGRTFWGWYKDFELHGEDGLFDDYRNCGGHSRYNNEIHEIVDHLILKMLDREREQIKTIVENVQSAIRIENLNREARHLPDEPLPVPGYDFIHSRIFTVAPIDHAIRRFGKDKAYKDMHALGVGIKTTRALERVEIDEYTIDLFSLMSGAGLFNHLPPAIKKFIGLNGKPTRVTLSAAIDVHTRCLLALQIVPNCHASPLRSTVEMIYMDKTDISDAAGCVFSWAQAGAPEKIVLDRGPKYVTDDAYQTLASLGITNVGSPAGKPWLKPFIERLFRILHEDLLQRFSGRAFSNVVERGDNDSASRATLTLEAFLRWLVRWTVDAYHTRVHGGIGTTPAQAWQNSIETWPPRSLANHEMREAFGVRMKRKLTPRGIRVRHIDYQNDYTMRLLYTPGVSEIEILRWHGDVGAIMVRHDNGPWVQVTAADEKWIGKTDLDISLWLSKKSQQTSEEEAARDGFLNDVFEESYRLKALAGLVSLPKTEDELERDIAEFSRFADTAERRHEYGDYEELFSGLRDAVGLDDQDKTAAGDPDCPPPISTATINEDDLME